jgi:hypothetical protein
MSGGFSLGEEFLPASMRDGERRLNDMMRADFCARLAALFSWPPYDAFGPDRALWSAAEGDSIVTVEHTLNPFETWMDLTSPEAVMTDGSNRATEWACDG